LGYGGIQGESAYEIAVNNGFTGTEVQWLDSLNGADGADGVDGGFDSTQTVSEIPSGDFYTLQASDAGKLFVNNVIGFIEVILSTSTALPVGAQVDFLQTASSQILFGTFSGVTLYSKDGNLRTAGQYSPASIKCIAANTYVLIGDLGA